MTFLIIHGIQGHAGNHWQQWLKEQLETQGHTVLMPQMPEAEHPDRFVWLNTVQTIVKDVPSAELIIVGHSLGVPTALDYIEQLASPVKGLVSVAGFASDYGAELNSYFMSQKQINLNKVRQNVNKAIVFYSDNDSYVTAAALKQVADGLNVKPHVVKNGGHLNTAAGFTTFPELLEAINSEIL